MSEVWQLRAPYSTTPRLVQAGGAAGLLPARYTSDSVRYQGLPRLCQLAINTFTASPSFLKPVEDASRFTTKAHRVGVLIVRYHILFGFGSCHLEALHRDNRKAPQR